MTGAAALGVLAPAVASLLYACRARVLAGRADTKAQSAHDRLDALSAAPAPAGEAGPPPERGST